MTRGPDMTRSAGDGFTVTARYVPSLATPVLAIVAVKRHGWVVGAITVPACAGINVFRHAAIYVPGYADAMEVGV